MATNAQVLAAIEALAARLDAIEAKPAATPTSQRSAEASAHWKSRDLTCKAGTCDKRFRTEAGQAFHATIHVPKA